MFLAQPSFLSITNAEESVFLFWSYVPNATEYEIEVKINGIETKQTYLATRRSILIKQLENDRFYSVQVTALYASERSEPSIAFMVRPKLRQSLSVIKVKPGEKAGRVCLRWTSTPTDHGFQVERCDVGETTGYKRVAWFPSNTVTEYEDQTGCDASKHACSGHYYTVKYRDVAWWHGAGVLSKKVFCMSSEDSYSDIATEKYDELDNNIDPNSVKESVVIPDSAVTVVTERDLISSEKLLTETAEEDENVHIDQASKLPIIDNALLSTSSKDLFETVSSSGENSPNVSEEVQA